MMNRRICLMLLFLGIFAVTAGACQADGPYYNGYGRGGPGLHRYYGYGNGRYDNAYGPRRLNPYGYSNYRNGPYGNGYIGNGYGNMYGNGYSGYANEYNYRNGYNHRNGYVDGGPFGFGISIF